MKHRIPWATLIGLLLALVLPRAYGGSDPPLPAQAAGGAPQSLPAVESHGSAGDQQDVMRDKADLQKDQKDVATDGSDLRADERDLRQDEHARSSRDTDRRADRDDIAAD